MIDDVRAILNDWDWVDVSQLGHLWIIRGAWRGAGHSGARDDALALAADLRRITTDRVNDAPAIDVLEPAPDPAPAPAASDDLSLDQAPQEVVEPAQEPEAVEAAPAPAQEEVEVIVEPAASLVAQSYPGLFIQTDDEARLRADVITAITMYERERLSADMDSSRRDDHGRAIVDYHNKGALGVLDDHDRRNYAAAMQYQQREAATRAHADQLRDAAVSAALPKLQAMIATYREGWP